MTAKEFLLNKTLDFVEVCDDKVILNLGIEGIIYGMDVDTSHIISGTNIDRTEDFQIEDDVLTTSEGLSVNLAKTNML
jgi:hypothetical protein